MSYLVQNVSGIIQTAPKSLLGKAVAETPNNWAIGQIDKVDDEMIDFYKGHTDSWNIMAGPTLYGAPGVAPGSGITAVDYSDGAGNHKTVITLAAGAVLPAIAGGAGLGVGVLVYTFPVGAHVINSSYFNVGITQTQGHINANTPDVGLGTVIASGAVVVLDGTATFENISTGISATNCTGTKTPTLAAPTAGAPFIMNAADAHTLYFNAAFNWSASGDAGALLAGTITINWSTLA